MTLTTWVRVRVRVTGDAHITRVLGMGTPKTRGCPCHCDTGKFRMQRELRLADMASKRRCHPSIYIVPDIFGSSSPFSLCLKCELFVNLSIYFLVNNGSDKVDLDTHLKQDGIKIVFEGGFMGKIKYYNFLYSLCCNLIAFTRNLN